MEAFMARMQKQLEVERANPPPSTESFCYICGGASNRTQLLKRSTFVADENDDREDDFDTLYEDYCTCSEENSVSDDQLHEDSCRRRVGYDQSVIRLKDVKHWNPLENTEWTVTNPQKTVNLGPLVSEASETSKPGYSFKIQTKAGNQTDLFSSIPTELRLRVLEMLPTNSVLNLFLASPAFREVSLGLPQRFWRSRLSFDVPWCAEAAIRLVAQDEKHPFLFDKLLRLIREASEPDELNIFENGIPDAFVEDWRVLKNLRRIWINCEQIINDVEARHTTVRRQTGSASSQIGNLTSHKTIFVSRDFKGMPGAASVASFVTSAVKRHQLTAIIAHLGTGDQIIGIEFQLLDELSGRLFGNSSNSTIKVTLKSQTVITGVCISFGSPELNQNERRIRGLGFVTRESPEKPTHILGRWDEHDVLQILRVQPGMEVGGVTGEFNAQTITAFGIITANQLFTPINPSQPLGIDLDIHTQWVGRYPPLEWPLGQYFLESRRDGTGTNYPILTNPFPRVLEPPVHFVDLSKRKLCQVQAYGNFDAAEPHERFLKGLVFHFTDGSMERVGIVTSHQDILMSPVHGIEFEVEKNETIVDMVLYCAHGAVIDKSKAKLCGLQFITSLGKKLALGCTETGARVRKEAWPPVYSDLTEYGSVCGIQVALKPDRVERVGLALWTT
ncbi:hypothetical protein N7517_011061 [Penicillium concentricum]|uniref:F-box domain-containing protein n=1 Tax=Penicillium concentricum TaxID=293559 RepID=A0A9W9RA60_9EURO|nr:uncharacterized protein N7517_011061 [Penicillium concentricum]KAJ5356452.1 hypothetical protein N7517_011061 [Penicillium concentricum]